MKRGDCIALLTSGGDAPGMNAALRAAGKVAHALGSRVLGVLDGYAGLMDGRLEPIDLRLLDEAGRRGGTILGTARSKTFMTPEGRQRARDQLAKHDVKGLIVIGGNGSLTGARTLLDADLAIAGLPASIDNDLACTSMAIGVDTAMNTIVDACDRVLDTAAAHRRTFLVEVMGRDCGYLAMTSAVAAGADAVLVPEIGQPMEAIVDQIVRAMERAYADGSGRRRALVVKAEGVQFDNAALMKAVQERIVRSHHDVDTRVTVLGHVVRGGAPTAFDRLLAARLANAAVRALLDGETDFMAGWCGPGVVGAPTKYDPYVVLSPLDVVLRETKRLMNGESEVAKWRKRIVQEIESILSE